MKKLICFSVVVMLVLALAACKDANPQADILIDKKEIDIPGYYSLNYTRFTGERQLEIYVDFDKNVTIDVLTLLGKIDTEVFGKDENGVEVSLYYGKDIKTSTSDVFLEEGEYRIMFYGTGHTGGFTVEY